VFAQLSDVLARVSPNKAGEGEMTNPYRGEDVARTKPGSDLGQRAAAVQLGDERIVAGVGEGAKVWGAPFRTWATFALCAALEKLPGGERRRQKIINFSNFQARLLITTAAFGASGKHTNLDAESQWLAALRQGDEKLKDGAAVEHEDRFQGQYICPCALTLSITKLYSQFSNLFGTVYGRGNLLFSPDGTCLLSPVGNRVSVFDLVKYGTQFWSLGMGLICALAVIPHILYPSHIDRT
jgi:hypothetical protein